MEGTGVIYFLNGVPFDVNIKVARKTLNKIGISMGHYVYFTEERNLI